MLFALTLQLLSGQTNNDVSENALKSHTPTCTITSMTNNNNRQALTEYQENKNQFVSDSEIEIDRMTTPIQTTGKYFINIYFVCIEN